MSLSLDMTLGNIFAQLLSSFELDPHLSWNRTRSVQ